VYQRNPECQEGNPGARHQQIEYTACPMDFTNYLPVLLIIVMAVAFGVINLVVSNFLGPKRSGDIKDAPYESGMNPIGSARKRFNIRFYILAMTFLVFDIEIIFLYPWAVDFTQLAQGSAEATLFLGRVLFFLLMSIIAYIYAWKKGVFNWE